MLKTLLQNKQLWRRRPEINLVPDDHHRKVNRLDLFFDLVFVIVIGQLAHLFHGEITRNIILEFLILFVPVWRIWIGSTYYVARFEDHTVRHRVYMMLLMIPILGMWYGIHTAMWPNPIWYVWSYIIAKTLLAIMRVSWSDAQQQSKDLKKVWKFLMISNLIIVAIWIGSLWIPEPRRYVIRFVTMFGELFASWTQRSDTTDDIPDFHMGHLTERFGLFTIIVLAEIIIWVFAGMSEIHHLTLPNIVTAIATFLIACLLWWIYFDQIMSRPLIETKGENAQLFLWTYGHLPLTLWIIAVWWTLVHIVNSHDHSNEMIMWITVFGLCLILLTIWLLAQFHQWKTHEGVVDLCHTQEDLNKHLLLTKVIASWSLIAWWAFWMHSQLEMYRFVIGVVVILSALALEWLMYWVHAMTEHSH